MAKRTIIISDIHIGNNYRTAWYQKKYHEPYLLTLLNWVVDNKDDIDRFIILGDLFDFWTYPPDQTPPTTDEIIDANPNILGPNGGLSRVLTALKGNVLYLHGNHDITVTQSDLNKIQNPDYQIALQPDVYVKDGTVYTHGHLFTMFNAPDPQHSIPVGHFVTRAISYLLDTSLLKPGQTAADLVQMGAPSGISLKSLGFVLSDALMNPSIVGALIDFMASTANMPLDYPIKMADGSTTNLAQVKHDYEYLWTNWANRFGGGEKGQVFAYKGAWADYDGSYMGWWAQRAAFQYDARLIVMGHTHAPKDGLKGGYVNYINSGFECVPEPDMPKQAQTYSTVQTEDNEPKHWKVIKIVKDKDNYKFQDDDPGKDWVISSYAAGDFSCYITVENKTNHSFNLTSTKENQGYFVTQPPQTIPARSEVKFWIQDFLGLHGSDGEAKYDRDDGKKDFQLKFEDPTGIFSNACSGGSYFYTRSGDDSDWGSKNHVKGSGHPFFVKFVFDD